jgi:hypothetical protein
MRQGHDANRLGIDPIEFAAGLTLSGLSGMSFYWDSVIPRRSVGRAGFPGSRIASKKHVNARDCLKPFHPGRYPIGLELHQRIER